MSDINTIISLIKQGQVAPVKQLLSTSTSPTDTIALIHASIEVMNLDILRYLLDTFKPDSKTPVFRDTIVMEATGQGRAEAFKILSEYNPSILTRDLSHMGSALAHSVLANNIPLASFLLTGAGIDPNERRVYGGRPPIVSATHLGMFEMVNLLMKHGAQVKGTDALFEVMTSDRIDMLSYLVNRKGVDINMIQPVEGSEELTPGPVLHLAVQMRNSKMVQLLLKEFGADPLVKDQNGKTAVDLARCISDPAIRKQLDPTYSQCQII